MKKLGTIILSCTLAMSLLLTGCSSNQPSSQDGGETSSSTQSTVTPLKKDILTIGFGEALENYNPVNGYETRSSMILLTYETLFQYDDGEIVPCLAETYVWNDDMTEVTLSLRKNITFHDGEPFNAQAVIKNIEWMKANPLYGWIGGISSIETIEEIDENTVLLKYKSPYYAALQDLSLPVQTAIVSPAMLDMDNMGVMTGTAGTGPYAFKGYDNEKGVAAFEQNESYWKDTPDYSKIDVKYIPDENIRMIALESGEIDLIFSSTWISYDNYTQAIEVENIKGKTSEESIKTRYLTLNAQNTILADFAVREAIGYAVDANIMSEGLLQGFEKTATSILDSSLPYCDVTIEKVFITDLEKANEILETAGWIDENDDGIREKNGQNLELALTYPQELSFNKEIVEIIRTQLKEIGMDVQAAPSEYMLWAMAVMGGEFDISLVTTNGLPYDPQNTVNPMLTGAVGEYTSIKALENGEEFFSAGQLASTSPDKEVVQENYVTMLNFLMNNIVDIPLTSQQEIVVFNTDAISDYEFGGTTNFFYPENVK